MARHSGADQDRCLRDWWRYPSEMMNTSPPKSAHVEKLLFNTVSGTLIACMSHKLRNEPFTQRIYFRSAKATEYDAVPVLGDLESQTDVFSCALSPSVLFLGTRWRLQDDTWGGVTLGVYKFDFQSRSRSELLTAERLSLGEDNSGVFLSQMLDISPDGMSVVLKLGVKHSTGPDAFDVRYGIFAVSIDTGQAQRLTELRTTFY